LGENPVQDYLVIEKGILSLRNCRIDAREFSRCVQQGLNHGRNRQWWQAGLFLDRALETWNGPFCDHLLPGDEPVDYGRELLHQLKSLGLAWCPVLNATGHQDKALEIAEKIVPEAPHDEQMVHLLYTLYLRNKTPGQAKDLYGRYEQLLQCSGYSEAEIQQLLDRLVRVGPETPEIKSLS
jgi:DNA-binding SARP family transcriptional activator